MPTFAMTTTNLAGSDFLAFLVHGFDALTKRVEVRNDEVVFERLLDEYHIGVDAADTEK